jgi:hypothetical protein
LTKNHAPGRLLAIPTAARSYQLKAGYAPGWRACHARYSASVCALGG